MNFFSVKNRSFFAFFITTVFSSFSLIAAEQNNTFFTSPLTESTWNFTCEFDFVQDANGKKFILKYPRSTEHAISDALGAKIGKDVGVNINDVKIFPPKDPSISSVDKHPLSVKTLHTVVPGEEVNSTSYANIWIKDPYHKDYLHNLALHKDLCKIVALDIYLDNWDRHNRNFFYDKQNKKFYAIDMDMILKDGRHNFDRRPTQTISFVKTLNKDNLSRAEKNALRQVNKTLHKLTSQYPPEKLQSTRMELAQEAHYTYNPSEQQKFNNLTEYNFKETQKLQVLLKTFDLAVKPISTHLILKHMAKPSRAAENSFWETMHS